MGQRSVQMNADQYLLALVRRETVDTGENSPVRGVIGILRPALVKWGNNYLASIAPSGSFAKGTAIRSAPISTYSCRCGPRRPTI
jgi:hypothetical protein